MPSALETLVKVLKLEREQGFKDTSTTGGLSDFVQQWVPTAHQQARKPEHHALVDEIGERLTNYHALTDKKARNDPVLYLLNRITGRIPQQNAARKDVQESDNANISPQFQRPARRDGDRQSERERSRTERGASIRRSRPYDRGHDGEASQIIDDEVRQRHDTLVGEIRKPARRDLPLPVRLSRPPRRPRPKVPLDQAQDTLRGLRATVDKIRGIGDKNALTLGKLGIQTINDMLFFLPRRFDDYTQLAAIARLKPNQPVTVIGTIRHAEVRVGAGKRRDFFIVLDDGTSTIAVTFFTQYYLQQKLRIGTQITLSGIPTLYHNRLQMTNPDWEYLDPEDLHRARIVPVYPLTEGLTQKKIRGLMQGTLDHFAERIPDYIPEATLERCELGDLGWTLRNLHFPESQDHLAHAKRRYIFDQLMLLQLAILANRKAWQAVPSYALDVPESFVTDFAAAVFPYALTGAQKRVLEDIRQDLRLEIPMNRLLQGDVGSGKTAVAITALAMAFANGKQGALMAPTGILAEQHYRNISRVMQAMPSERKPVIALLTSALSVTERERIYAGLADGVIDIVIGTHAVIQSGVAFKHLAVGIIDEQHRFGVEQRGALRGKGHNPHLLVMTATPIPRTLALTIHADLDLSIMDEMPVGRIPIKTRILEPRQREKAYEFIEQEISNGRQAFIVYPLVEASDKIDAGAAVEAFDHLKRVFHKHRVGLLHGKMKANEKDDIMAAFSNGEYAVLVTTSVAEVGVDVPNASVMMIEDANRFGLAQLHQFRGRVGRGQHASYCLLICETDDPTARERLTALESTNDGFKLAEFDWKLRGAGDLIGTRQSGQNTLQLMEDMSPELVELAQREARTIFTEDPDLRLDDHRLLGQRINTLRDLRSDVS
jgi:ATP-dependent DNA helicase RecG